MPRRREAVTQLISFQYFSASGIAPGWFEGVKIREAVAPLHQAYSRRDPKFIEIARQFIKDMPVQFTAVYDKRQYAKAIKSEFKGIYEELLEQCLSRPLTRGECLRQEEDVWNKELNYWTKRYRDIERDPRA